MLDPTIVEPVRRYLRAVDKGGIHVSFGMVFGSRVAQTADAWSDIDLIVVSPRFDDTIENEDVDRLWQLSARIDSRIEPVPCGERQWSEDDSSTILEVARRHGQRITLYPSEPVEG